MVVGKGGGMGGRGGMLRSLCGGRSRWRRGVVGGREKEKKNKKHVCIYFEIVAALSFSFTCFSKMFFFF